MHPLGRLEVICGPMFSGKTTALIRRLQTAADSGSRTRALKPAQDTRYAGAAPALSTHAGEALGATAVASAAQVVKAAGPADIVGIDEAHFFGAALVKPVLALLGAGRRVIVAGLERDHRGRPFHPLPALLVEADEVLKLTCPCAQCGRPAVHSQRMSASRARIAVGGAGEYQPRCRACFTPGR